MASTETYNFIRIIPREPDFLSRRVGSRGEIFWDRDTNTLKLYDGTVRGGLDLARADLSNISNSVFAAKATSAGVGGSSGGGNTTVTVGDTLPTSPANGNLWLNTSSGYLYVYFDDGDTEQWIQPAFPTFSGDYNDLTNKPTIPVNVSDLPNDAGYINSIPNIFAEDSTLLVDVVDGILNTSALDQAGAANGQALIWDNASSSWIPGDVTVDLGNFTFTGSVLDTDDSSGITVTPALTLESDLTVENELFADKAQITNLVLTGEITTQGSGTPEIVSDNEINLIAGTKIVLNGLTELFSSTEVMSTISGATGVTAHDLDLGAVFNHVSIAGNFTANFTNVPLTNDRVISVALVLNQGATPYMPTAIQINDVSVTPEYQGGGGTPSGNANQTDIVSFTLIRYSNSWTVIGSLTTYA